MTEMEIVSNASDADAEENSVKKISIHFLDGICGCIWTPCGVDFDCRIGGGRIQGKIALRIPSSLVGKAVPRNPHVLGLTPRGVIVDVFCRYCEPTVPFSRLPGLQATTSSWNQSTDFLNQGFLKQSRHCSPYEAQSIHAQTVILTSMF